MTLEAGREPRSEQRTEYMVSIFTGSQRGADTTGDVEVELVGEAGSSGPQALHAGETTFARGKRDDFGLQLPYLGVLKELRVRQDGKGAHPDWYLDKIEVGASPTSFLPCQTPHGDLKVVQRHQTIKRRCHLSRDLETSYGRTINVSSSDGAHVQLHCVLVQQ